MHIAALYIYTCLVHVTILYTLYFVQLFWCLLIINNIIFLSIFKKLD